MITVHSRKLLIFLKPHSKGGLAEEVDEKILQSAFLPFGETVVQIPLDYATGM